MSRRESVNRAADGATLYMFCTPTTLPPFDNNDGDQDVTLAVRHVGGRTQFGGNRRIAQKAAPASGGFPKPRTPLEVHFRTSTAQLEHQYGRLRQPRSPDTELTE